MTLEILVDLYVGVSVGGNVGVKTHVRGVKTHVRGVNMLEV